MSTRIRIGLIGAGSIAGQHVRGYLANPDLIDFIAVADPVEANGSARIEGTDAVWYPDYAAILERDDIDAVDICLPHHLHRDAILAAAGAGKHILIEKPICLTIEEADEVIAAVEAAGVTLMSAHNHLFHPQVVAAKQLIEDGALGELYHVRTTDAWINDADPANMGWRATAKTSGGGELIDTGYHPSYLLHHFSQSKPTEVFAMLSTHRLTFMEGEDTASVVVRFANGVVGTILTSWAFEASRNTERFSVVGEHGSLYSDGSTLVLSKNGEESETFSFEPVNLFAAEIEHFATSLINGTRPIHTEIEGAEVLATILAAYESARTGTLSKVAPIGAQRVVASA